MTSAEFEDLWKPARNTQYFYAKTDRGGTERSRYLAALLGLDRDAYEWKKVVLTPEITRTLRMLVGPHYLTIIKMLELKKEKQLES